MKSTNFYVSCYLGLLEYGVEHGLEQTGFGRSVLKSEYGTVLKMFGDLR